MVNKRAALLVRCTAEEAQVIREAAKKEHRSIDAFILNVLGRIAHQKDLEAKFRLRGIRPRGGEMDEFE